MSDAHHAWRMSTAIVRPWLFSRVQQVDATPHHLAPSVRLWASGPLCVSALSSIACRDCFSHGRQRGGVVEGDLAVVVPHAQLFPPRIQIGRERGGAHLLTKVCKDGGAGGAVADSRTREIGQWAPPLPPAFRMARRASSRDRRLWV